MIDSYLHEFSAHIATWAQALIAEGRYPFRRAEIYPHLIAEAPTSCPPLILWINRDSFMAGGVLLFSNHTHSDVQKQGQSVAAALGIPHYVIWGRHDVTIWNCSKPEPTVHKQLVINPATPLEPGDFQTLLLQVLIELKLLCVTEILSPGDLSPYYFANLFLATATAATPAIDREYRLSQINFPISMDPPTHQVAEQRAFLFLLHLVALVAFERLPLSIQTENLEQASRYALETLPPQAVPMPDSHNVEPHLGNEAAIRFHHLFRRLTQLEISRDHERVAQSLDLLFPLLSARFFGFPISISHRTQPGSTLLVNPDRLSEVNIAAEIASQPLLANFSLIRALRNTPSPLQQSISPMAIKAELSPDRILGTLYDTTIPTGRERTTLTTLLRNSWPGRRWTFPTATPRWAWEFLHLMGIATCDTVIELSVPNGWLVSPFASQLLDLLCSDFAVERVAETNADLLTFTLRKQATLEQGIAIVTGAGERLLPWAVFVQAPGASLALAFQLPNQLFELLRNGQLHPVIQLDTMSASRLRGMELFCHSTLGRLLWKIVSAGRPIPQRDTLALQIKERGLPIPAGETLDQLTAGLPDELNLPSTQAIDFELERWFVLTAPPGAQDSDRERGQRQRLKSTTIDDTTLIEQITEEVFVDGIPIFPEHYLINHFRPETYRYEISERLEIQAVFFDMVTLQAPDGFQLDVEGLETAESLVFASQCRRKSLQLPVDRKLTASILERYKHDLTELHRRLRQRISLETNDPRHANALCDTIWNRHLLPPRQMLEL